MSEAVNRRRREKWRKLKAVGLLYGFTVKRRRKRTMVFQSGGHELVLGRETPPTSVLKVFKEFAERLNQIACTCNPASRAIGITDPRCRYHNPGHV